MVWVWAWVCLICVYLCGCPLCKHIIIIYGVRYKNAFSLVWPRSCSLPIFSLYWPFFPLLLFYGVVYNEKCFLLNTDVSDTSAS